MNEILKWYKETYNEYDKFIIDLIFRGASKNDIATIISLKNRNIKTLTNGGYFDLGNSKLIYNSPNPFIQIYVTPNGNFVKHSRLLETHFTIDANVFTLITVEELENLIPILTPFKQKPIIEY